MSLRNHVDELVDEMVGVVQSDRNYENAKLWEPQPTWARDLWRGIPRNTETGVIPITVDPAKYLWSQIAGFDFQQYYNDADMHLIGNLRMNLHKFRVFRDNTYFDREVDIWFGWVFELSMFGAPVIWRDIEEPVIGEPPVLNNPRALDDLKPPDFYRSGLMPRVHQFYEQMQERVGDRLRVAFPTWCRGPFSIAVHLRGMQKLLVDIMENPQFVHRLMRFIVDSEKQWLEERARFTGEPIEPGKLYNDEIGAPLISPNIYRDFVLPYETELGEFRGGITYFHSCGNTTPFLPFIKRLPDLKLFHVGPWTDRSKAVDVMAPDVSLDFCFHPVDDVLYATESHMREYLGSIIEICEPDTRFSVRCDSQHLMRTVEEDHEKILAWRRIAGEVLGQYSIQQSRKHSVP